MVTLLSRIGPARLSPVARSATGFTTDNALDNAPQTAMLAPVSPVRRSG